MSTLDLEALKNRQLDASEECRLEDFDTGWIVPFVIDKDIPELVHEVQRLRKALTEIAFDTENRKREIAVKALES